MRVGLLTARTTFAVTLPISILDSPLLPCVDIAIMALGRSFARLIIDSWAGPSHAATSTRMAAPRFSNNCFSARNSAAVLSCSATVMEPRKRPCPASACQSGTVSNARNNVMEAPNAFAMTPAAGSARADSSDPSRGTMMWSNSVIMTPPVG